MKNAVTTVRLVPCQTKTGVLYTMERVTTTDNNDSTVKTFSARLAEQYDEIKNLKRSLKSAEEDRDYWRKQTQIQLGRVEELERQIITIRETIKALTRFDD